MRLRAILLTFVTDRFQRLYQLNQAVGILPYQPAPPRSSYSPLNAYTPGKPELVEAMNIIQKVCCFLSSPLIHSSLPSRLLHFGLKVELPLGVNYISQLETGPSVELDQVQWTVLRDHSNLVLYFNSPANPMWQVIKGLVECLSPRFMPPVLMLSGNQRQGAESEGQEGNPDVESALWCRFLVPGLDDDDAPGEARRHI